MLWLDRSVLLYFFTLNSDKIPRKSGPGITQADLLVINKTTLAATVGADLSVMERDALRMRDGGPIVFAQIEIMSEEIDETLDKDEAEEETEDFTNQVLDEIGVGVASQLYSAPKGRIATKTAAPPASTTNNNYESREVDELEKRLASLLRRI